MLQFSNSRSLCHKPCWSRVQEQMLRHSCPIIHSSKPGSAGKDKWTILESTACSSTSHGEKNYCSLGPANVVNQTPIQKDHTSCCCLFCRTSITPTATWKGVNRDEGSILPEIRPHPFWFIPVVQHSVVRLTPFETNSGAFCSWHVQC